MTLKLGLECFEVVESLLSPPENAKLIIDQAIPSMNPFTFNLHTPSLQLTVIKSSTREICRPIHTEIPEC